MKEERSSTEVSGRGHGENSLRRYVIQPGKGRGCGWGLLTRRRRQQEPMTEQLMQCNKFLSSNAWMISCLRSC
ncbi:hypothetical protein NC652_025197 [Populus alba x Populus x berolinensis]|nr:hypothetical protein NC651_024085 [Populus alba x Populus x berolinensis]KAJ6898605.1 hypothetical protein NC652_025197 [Populus alba x Populus x berolinensis]